VADEVCASPDSSPDKKRPVRNDKDKRNPVGEVQNLSFALREKLKHEIWRARLYCWRRF
jgi:hypothetical protein